MPDFRSEIRQRLAQLALPPGRDAEIVEELSQHLEEDYETALSRGSSEEHAHRAALESLAESDLLGRELEPVERRARQSHAPIGVQRTGNMIGRSGTGRALWPADAGEESGLRHRGACARSRHWREQRDLQRRQRHPAAAVALQESRPARNDLGERDASRLPKNTPSAANFLDWQRQANSFSGMAAIAPRSYNLTGVGELERLDGRRVSANLFDLLGVKPLIGRSFVPQDDQPGTKIAIP